MTATPLLLTWSFFLASRSSSSSPTSIPVTRACLSILAAAMDPTTAKVAKAKARADTGSQSERRMTSAQNS